MAAAAIAWSADAGAQTLNLSVDGGGGYDSNVFGTQESQPSGVFRFRVAGGLTDDLERLDYTVGYSPTVLVYTRDDGEHALNHNLYADGTYDLTQRTQITLRDDFAHVENIQQDIESQTVNNQGDQTQIRNSVTTTLSHQLTPRWGTGLTTRYDLYHYSSGRQEDSEFLTGQAFTTYALNAQTTVGMGGVVGYRTFDPSAPIISDCSTVRRPGTRSVNYQGFASLRHQWDQNTSFSVRAGPAVVDTRSFVVRSDVACPGTPPPNDPGQLFVAPNDRSNFTWFAQASADRRWKFVSANVAYRRTEGVGGSGSGTSINDSVFGSLSWRIGRLWSVSAGGSWLQRDSTSGLVENTATQQIGSQDVTTWTLNGSISRQLTERSSVSLIGSYVDQTTSRPGTTSATGTTGNQTTGYHAYRIDVRYTYRFAPVIF